MSSCEYESLGIGTRCAGPSDASNYDRQEIIYADNSNLGFGRSNEEYCEEYCNNNQGCLGYLADSHYQTLGVSGFDGTELTFGIGIRCWVGIQRPTGVYNDNLNSLSTCMRKIDGSCSLLPTPSPTKVPTTDGPTKVPTTYGPSKAPTTDDGYRENEEATLPIIVIIPALIFLCGCCLGCWYAYRLRISAQSNSEPTTTNNNATSAAAAEYNDAGIRQTHVPVAVASVVATAESDVNPSPYVPMATAVPISGTEPSLQGEVLPSAPPLDSVYDQMMNDLRN
mmetsp:Transcript_9556/g.15598  ORF Transcript_9556/g.15598 Transcript_9556/m.15598 type:complete len:281 (+) Transcript_9556:61-903(+)|eukprot:CAMPEP_0201882550 /NCGR_PEP_ID=MMETSP0902-20130614/14270_1 /ASSEMBLY_ACC=CAM_ASM_000551 /TAXON_ID=420261 /ORGANISM="Thalassiosira antarctica, Strain CCMP982" /LENGTH=280 /DNA_ID=CAMNT_0048411119 /DNA_START=30 /DNA_END=872 /DNA_ORIENTATION=-